MQFYLYDKVVRILIAPVFLIYRQCFEKFITYAESWIKFSVMYTKHKEDILISTNMIF